LFEKEQCSLLIALCFDRSHPFGAHGPSTVPAFSADNDPVYTGKVEDAQVFEEWFDA
jgi:hypothetical protein